MNKLFLILIASFTTTHSYGQSTEDKQLVKALDQLLTGQFKQNAPGVALLLARNGKVVYEKAFGSSNLELNVPMKSDAVFRIGSITKQFTAIGILQLIEQGKLSLMDSVQRYIKDFPSKDYTINIEHLLTHTSGIKDYGNADTVNAFIEREDFTAPRIINYFKNEPLEFKPGTKYGYSNSNYVLLAYIIEKITGDGYHKYMEENVIKPAGLTNTYYATESAIVPMRAAGYTRNKGFFENCEYQTISLGYGCGDLMSTAGDLYKWNNTLLSYKLIKNETLQKAFTPYKLYDGTFSNYGYGWFIDNFQGTKCIHHEGQVSGFIAEEKYFPDRDIYAVILTNLQSGEDTTDFSYKRLQLFDNIFSLALGKELLNEITVGDEMLNKYIGTYQADSLFENDGLKKTKVDSKERITVDYKNGKLFATLSNSSGVNMVLLPQTNTMFFLPDVKRIRTTIQFIIANDKVKSIYWTQEHKSEWTKIK